MKGLARFFVAAVALALSACGGGSDSKTTTPGGGNVPTAIQATWSSCQADGGGGSYRMTLVIGAGSFSSSWSAYAAAGCAGTPVASGTGTGSVAVTGTASVPLGSGGPNVTASLVTVNETACTPTPQCNTDLGVSYDLAYVDVNQTPNRLYFGDDENGTKDGSTPALRPTRLDSTTFSSKQ